MPALRFPGVTITEIDNSAVPARVSTGVPAGVIGTADQGPSYVPLTFSSSLYVEDIGTFSRNEVINGCFIGTSYKPDWVSDLPNIKYITNYNNNFPEDERIKIFLSSKH